MAKWREHVGHIYFSLPALKCQVSCRPDEKPTLPANENMAYQEVQAKVLAQISKGKMNKQKEL